MKTYVAVLSIVFCSLGFGKLWAQHEPATGYKTHRMVGLEASPGLGTSINTNNGTRWQPQLGIGLGANYYHSVSSRVWLHSGISEQLCSAYRTVEHPYPYVMIMSLNSVCYSARLRAGADYVFRQIPNLNQSLYIGADLYADVVQGAKVHKRIHYVDESEAEIINFKDSFAPVVPGVQLSLGSQFQNIRVELRYWEDIATYSIPTVPIGRQRRAFYGLNCSILLGSRF